MWDPHCTMSSLFARRLLNIIAFKITVEDSSSCPKQQGEEGPCGLASPFPASAGPSSLILVPAQTPFPRAGESHHCGVGTLLSQGCCYCTAPNGLKQGGDFPSLTPQAKGKTSAVGDTKPGRVLLLQPLCFPWSPLPSQRLISCPQHLSAVSCIQVRWQLPPWGWGRGCVGGCWGAPSSPIMGK